jgi:uncharacterized protein
LKHHSKQTIRDSNIHSTGIQSINIQSTSCQTCSSCAIAGSQSKSSLQAVLISIAVLVLIFFLTHTYSIPLPEIKTISVGIALLLGLFASISTCLATTGGLLLAINPDSKKSITFLFIIGRIVSYAGVGFLLGYIGKAFSFSAQTTSIFTAILGLLLVFLGLHQLYALPYPRLFSSVFASAKNHTKTAVIAGAVTVLIPCTFTQLVQVAVIASADPIFGALLLGLFAVGSIPGLLVVGLAPKVVPAQLYRGLTTFMSVAVVSIGLFTVYSAIVWQIPVAFTQSVQDTQLTDTASSQNQLDTSQESVQTIYMSIIGLDYHPNEFQIQVGKKTNWVIDSSKAVGCARSLTVPGLGISQIVGSKISTITFTPQKPGVFSFSCSMGMAGPGKLVIVE